MNQYASKLSGAAIWARIMNADPRWTTDGTQVLMGNGQSGGIPAFWEELCQDAIREIASVTWSQPVHLMVNRLPPGVITPVHIDPVAQNPPMRYHLPLVTNNGCFFWDEKRGFLMFGLGYWHRVDYKIKHAVGNIGEYERVHLIVDLQP